MEISSEKLENGVTRIQLSGRMDMQGTATIETKFTAYAVKDKGAVMVDMSAVSFLTQ